jgi:PBP1b-binding outer membrane lipoprotein LpoB
MKHFAALVFLVLFLNGCTVDKPICVFNCGDKIGQP